MNRHKAEQATSYEMDTSPSQENHKQANCSKRPCQWILAILVVGCFILANQYSWRLALQQSVLHSIYFHIQESKATNTTTQNPVTIATTLKPIRNTTILLWYWPFGTSSSLNGNTCSDDYGIPNCEIVTNHSRFPEADLVVFHNRELVNRQQMLPLDLPRPQTQMWVWLSMESPKNNGDMRPLAGHFNYTMSYRRDSDIYTPYGWLVPSKAPNGTTVNDFIPKGKTSLACWVVSNYQDRHERTIVYNKLKNIITVDLYGGSVNKQLSSENLIPTISRYYFYLSFENSIAKDYITEKVWYNAFMSGTVPVVLGPPREQYEAAMPKDSFIHVNDFSSVEELGHFMETLAKDKERYATYFNWRLNYTIRHLKSWTESLCGICPNVSHLPTQKVYEDLHGWNWQ